MKGTLHKTESGWVVRYSVFNEPHNINLEVSKISLTNEELSTYWVEGRKVLFVINPLIQVGGGDEVLIIPDGETWDDIFKNICDQDLTNLNDIWNWLKENYETPKRK